MNVVVDENLKRLRAKVNTLQKKPQPAQRSPEWFAARNTRITASEAASCLFKTKAACESYVKEFNLQNFKYKDTEPLNHYETREDYIIKKCSAFYGENVFKDTIYTLWGKKYEEVANRLYCQLNNTNVIEFGLVSHPRLRWLAASPDGITPDGVMLEIKCPKSRKIDESCVPLHYYIQTQIQMEVVGLELCDFFECEIEELENEQQFCEQQINESYQSKGIIFQIIDPNQTTGDPKFIYPPVEIRETEDYINWKNQLLEERQDITPIYFFIKKYYNQRVKRSQEWFANVKDDIKRTWDLIIKLQANKEEFEKYKDSIHRIKSKLFYEKYHRTECEIHDDDSTYIFEETIVETTNLLLEDPESTEEVTNQQEVVCLID